MSDAGESTAVLDTNVVLDCFAFDGPLAKPLADAVRAGAMRVITTEECLAELARVLAYPKLKLDEAGRARGLARFREVANVVPQRRVADVPRCRDRDDQKFLDLAAAERVQFLFSRDARVLATRAKMLRIFAVNVTEPKRWAEQFAGAAWTPSASAADPPSEVRHAHQ
ncbi:MAG: putative toxin-antitoxin system toxin component, PIN family [Burkholderiales bacterium]|nr:putative toxin-antitoxin system toxin component, PIN family [Burkholderiales bacterium]